MNRRSKLRWSFAVVLGVAVVAFGFASYRESERVEIDGRLKASALAAAIDGFYDEYDRLPDLGSSRFETVGEIGQKLLRVVLGEEGESRNMENPREVIFLQTLDPVAFESNLCRDQEGNVEGFNDPYGLPYVVVLRGARDSSLKFFLGDEEVELLGRQVAVWSVGKDGIEGTRDDLKSWD